METQSIHYRKYREGDEGKIQKLWLQVFKNNLDLNYWRWKYIENPFGDIHIQLAFDGDECVGQYAFLPIWLSNNGKRIRSLIALDNMVHEKYQRKGILKQLEKMASAVAGTEAYFHTFLNQNSFPVYSKQFGWKYLGRNHVLFKPLQLQSLISKNAFWRGLLPLVYLYKKAYPKKSANLLLKYFDKFDDETDTIWNANKKNMGITLERTREFMEWRFNGSPNRYCKLKITINGNCVGYFVLRIMDKFGLRIVWVMDLCFHESAGQEVFCEAMLAMEEIVKNEADMVSILLPQEKYREALHRAGYRGIPQRLLPHPFYFCVKSNEPSHQEFFSINQWYFSWAMHDVL